jgi:hypothetical protein
MKHARADYQRIQDPALEDPSLLAPGSTAISEDEPVMLFRAKDKHFCAVLEHYWRLLVNDPDAKPDIARYVAGHMGTALAWQEKNGCKTPDLPRKGGAE